MEEDYDVIVIGSGISGLLAASILSRAGQKVLLLEARKKFGGQVQTFKKEDFKFCVGLDMIEVTADMVLASGHHLFERTHRNSELYEFGDRKFVLESSNWENLKESLLKKFPKEKKSLSSFFEISEKTSESTKYFLSSHSHPFYIRWLWSIQGKFSLFHKYGRTSTETILNECGINDPFLRWFLSQNTKYFYNPNDTPTSFPNFSLHSRYNELLLPKKKVLIGPYGTGGENLIKTILPNLISEGSEVLGNAEVTNLLFSKNERKVIGVEINKSKKVFAKNIISSIGISNTLTLLNTLKKRKNKKKIKILNSHLKENPQTGYFFVLFIGLDLPAEDLGIHHGIHVIERQKEKNNLNKFMSISPPDFSGFSDLCSLRIFLLDSLEEEYVHFGKKCQVKIVCPINPDWFGEFEGTAHKRRGNGYEEVKENLTNLILDIVYEKYPVWEDHVVCLFSATNLTYRHYCRCLNRGACYGMRLGYDKLCGGFKNGRIMLSPVKSLFLVESDVVCCGDQRCIPSVMKACGAILGRDLFHDLRTRRKKMKEI